VPEVTPSTAILPAGGLWTPVTNPYLPRGRPVRNNFDLRLSKVMKFGTTKRAIISLDVYNLSNSDTVITFNNSFVPGGAWLTPTRIAPARYFKIGGQFDF
jgi:hypothetical protein